MEARNKILEAVAANRPTSVELQAIDSSIVVQYADVFGQFKSVLESIGGKVIAIEQVQQVQQGIQKEKQTGKFIVNTIPEFGDVDESLTALSAQQLVSVEKAYIKGHLGVAENGSIWVAESSMINRLLPFICQHLVLVLERKDIVATMHHAYQQLNTFKEGFGVFIAGPSKTADIEQSLVIGAHGARSLVVYVY